MFEILNIGIYLDFVNCDLLLPHLEFVVSNCI